MRVDIPFPDPRSRTYGVEGEESDLREKRESFCSWIFARFCR